MGIDTRDTNAAAKAFVRFFDITYPSLVDNHGELLVQLTGIIPINAIPSTMVVDPQGAIAATVVGPTDYTTLRGLVADVLSPSRSR